MFKNVIDDDVALYFCFDMSVRKLFAKEFIKALKDLEASALHRLSFFSNLLKVLHTILSILSKTAPDAVSALFGQSNFNQKIIKIKIGKVVVNEVPSSKAIILFWKVLAEGFLRNFNSDDSNYVDLGKMMLK